MNNRLKVLAKYPKAYEDVSGECYRIVDRSGGVLGYSYAGFDAAWAQADSNLSGSLNPVYRYMITYEIVGSPFGLNALKRTFFIEVVEPLDAPDKIMCVIRADLERKIGEWNPNYAFEPVILYLHLLKTETQP